MTTRGQAQPKAKPRRKRWWWITLAILIVLIGGWALYALTIKLHSARVLWTYTYADDEWPGCVDVLPDGGVSTLGRHSLELFDQKGKAVLSHDDPNDRLRSYIPAGGFTDSAGNTYICNDSTLFSYGAAGAKRWEAQIPVVNTDANGRVVNMNVDGNGVLVCSSASELLKFDFDGNLIFKKQSSTNLRFFANPVRLSNGGYLMLALPPRTGATAQTPQILMMVILDADLNHVWDSRNHPSKPPTQFRLPAVVPVVGIRLSGSPGVRNTIPQLRIVCG